MEGFDLLVKWMAKHHPDLDLSGLAVDDVEKEFMSDLLFKATTENVMEEVTDAAEVPLQTLSLMSSNLLFFFLFNFLFLCKARTIFLFGPVVLGN